MRENPARQPGKTAQFAEVLSHGRSLFGYGEILIFTPNQRFIPFPREIPMPLDSERRRVLIAAGPGANEPLRHLFCKDPLDSWDILEADSFSRARFLLQHNPCDVLLVNCDLFEREGGQGLAWLAWQRETPVVFLAGLASTHFQRAFELGVHVCLPRQLALDDPRLLAAAMDQALQSGAMRLSYQKAKDRLVESRQHVDRLVNMIWRTTPRHSGFQWFSHRYMLERLGDELSRVDRHQVPLTLALGEFQPATDAPSEDKPAIPDWTMDVIAKSKRRCDVAGQYGLDGFMLLMVQTPIRGGVHCCRRLQKAIEHPKASLSGPHSPLHVFFGVSSTATGKKSAVALLRAAEQNLEAARADDKERLVVD
jgi:GGDEF domain-containing protein